MTRIFTILAIAAMALLLVNFWLGARIGDLNEANQRMSALRDKLSGQLGGRTSSHDVPPALTDLRRELEPIARRRDLHFRVAILASLLGLLVNSLAITYFIGTGRWCKEVAATYGLDQSLVARSIRFKRRTYAWALSAVGAILLTAIFGAAADTDVSPAGRWADYHFIAATVMLGFVAWSFLQQATAIGQNSKIIQQMLDQVHQIRLEKGLPVE